MLFGIISLLLYRAFSLALDDSYQLEGGPQTTHVQDEASPALNEIVPPKFPYKDISYKLVTLEELQRLSDKEARCLNAINDGKNALHASLWAPPSNSQRHASLKAVCNGQTEPKVWFGQSKYHDADLDEKAPVVTHKDKNTAIIHLDTVPAVFKIELHGCNLCGKKNENDPNYFEIFIMPVDGRKKKKYQSLNQHYSDAIKPSEKKVRTKRSISSSLSMHSAKKNVGDSLTVTCTATTSNITWKDAAGHDIKTTLTSNPRVKESFSKSHNQSDLVFKDVSLSHQGFYTCVINNGGRIDREVFNLTVSRPIEKPVAKLTPSTKTVILDEGEDYSVICSGNSPNVTWKHSAGLAIPQYPGSQSYYFTVSDLKTNKTSLIFKNATSWHAGEFICSVNVSGAEAREKLTIIVKPNKLTFSPEDKDHITIKENKDYDITCEGPLKYITWTVNGVEVSRNKKDDIFQKAPEQKGRMLQAKLKFEDVQKKYSGKYVCSGLLAYSGASIERAFVLTVEDDDSFSDPKLIVDDKTFKDSVAYVRVNETYEITCKGDTEEVSWKGPPYGWKIPDDVPQTSTISIQAERVKKKKVALKFKKAAVSEEGTYTCQVTKRGKSKEKSFQLKVIDPAYFIGTPLSPTVRERDDVTLQCNTGGHPKPMVNWYFNEIFPDGRSNTKLVDGKSNPRYKFEGDNLRINNITYQEAGKYMCKASQDIVKGITIQRVLDVSVQHKPYPVKNHTILERKLNTYATLKCNMIANPAPQYTWFKKNLYTYDLLARPSPNSDLTIVMDTTDKFGEYKCQATNEFGFNEQYILVIPMEPPKPPEINVFNVSKNHVYLYAKAMRNSSFTHYNIEYKEKGTRDWSDVNVTLGETWDTPYELANLQQKTTYILRVRSINELGISNPSAEVMFTTAFGIRLTVSSTIVVILLLHCFLNL